MLRGKGEDGQRETMMKMGNIKYIHKDQQLKVERRHYWPIFLAENADDLRTQPDTRKILRGYAIYDDDVDAEEAAGPASKSQRSETSESRSKSAGSVRKSESRPKLQRSQTRAAETPVRDFSPTDLEHRMPGGDMSPQRRQTQDPKISQGNLGGSSKPSDKSLN